MKPSTCANGADGSTSPATNFSMRYALAGSKPLWSKVATKVVLWHQSAASMTVVLLSEAVV